MIDCILSFSSLSWRCSSLHGSITEQLEMFILTAGNYRMPSYSVWEITYYFNICSTSILVVTIILFDCIINFHMSFNILVSNKKNKCLHCIVYHNFIFVLNKNYNHKKMKFFQLVFWQSNVSKKYMTSLCRCHLFSYSV